MLRIPQLTLCALSLTLFAPSAPAQDAPRPQVDREAMWWAPTAEDWKKPVLITWQRTWEDALAVAKETGKPLLICVNMDGEIASEHYAGVRYRSLDTARLYEPYVCVIASVYRHSPRDYDEEGRRIPCPRFGTVTCGEHIAIEPLLYEQFFDERRIAPRHIMIELDGAEQYDVYYAWDTASVFKAIVDGVADRPLPPPVVRDDLSLEARVDSSAVEDRQAVELAWIQGDRELRRRLLEAALRARDVDEVDLLRLALFGFDVELARLARQALAQSGSEKAIDLIAEVLRTPMEPAEREALVEALERLGESWPRARTLAAVQRGLASRSDAIDVERWASALASAEGAASIREQYALTSRLEERAELAESRPADPRATVEVAEAFLSLALAPKTAPKYERLLLEDARRTALRAEELGATGWEIDASLAIAASRMGEREEARARAVAAMEHMPSSDDGLAAVQDWRAAEVLALFAEARRAAIVDAIRAKEQWPPQWMTDVHAAYSALSHHPDASDAWIADHYDFLRWLGASGQAGRVLDEGLARFPDSWPLHGRLRARILTEKGVDGIEPAYEAMLAAEDAPPSLEWFAGYASIVAAEFQRRVGEDAKAVAAYGRSIAHFERFIETSPEARESADHYVAIAIAGRARLALERGELELALAEILASFERRAAAAATQDGLNLSPVDTANMLRARLAEAERTEELATLQAALDALDPKLLELPAFEREIPGSRAGIRFPRRPNGERGAERNGEQGR